MAPPTWTDEAKIFGLFPIRELLSILNWIYYFFYHAKISINVFTVIKGFLPPVNHLIRHLNPAQSFERTIEARPNEGIELNLFNKSQSLMSTDISRINWEIFNEKYLLHKNLNDSFTIQRLTIPFQAEAACDWRACSTYLTQFYVSLIKF